MKCCALFPFLCAFACNNLKNPVTFKPMKIQSRITTLFVDIGGVLLTDGWNRKSRKRAAQHFNLDLKEMEDRHHLTFDTYEVGKISLDEYLERTVFYEKRSFSYAAFKKFMFGESKAFPEMIALISRLKTQYNLKVVVVSNEGRELTQHRIKKFKLDDFVDFFVSSSFVHFRKPDVDIFKIALDMAQSQPAEVLYIEDRPLFVQVAEKLGMNAIRHTDVAATEQLLKSYGLGA